jgi:hypothetical protein
MELARNLMGFVVLLKLRSLLPEFRYILYLGAIFQA